MYNLGFDGFGGIELGKNKYYFDIASLNKLKDGLNVLRTNDKVKLQLDSGSTLVVRKTLSGLIINGTYVKGQTEDPSNLILEIGRCLQTSINNLSKKYPVITMFNQGKYELVGYTSDGVILRHYMNDKVKGLVKATYDIAPGMYLCKTSATALLLKINEGVRHSVC